MDRITQERIAVNDARFREANENIRDTADEQDFPGPVPFICECADPACTQIVRMSIEEYEAIRADPSHFLNAPGHDVAAGSAARVVREADGYVVVEKVGHAGEVASELDAREPRG